MSASVRHSVINEELEMFQDQRDSQINQVDLSDVMLKRAQPKYESKEIEIKSEPIQQKSKI